MSDRAPAPCRRPARSLRWATAACAAVLLVAPAFGQTPVPPPSTAVPDVIDDRPPLPRGEPPVPPLPPKFRIDVSKPMFQGIEDLAPLKSEKEGPDEYRAWNTVVVFARQFEAAELEAVAARTLTFEDLVEGSRQYYKLRPVRFEGRLTKVDRVPPTADLQRDYGMKDMYVGQLVPVDEPASHALRIAFTDLPAGVVAADKLADKWVSFAGYSFKLLSEPPPPGGPKLPVGEWKKVPLLVGRSVTVLPAAPTPEGTEVARLPDKELRVFRLIRDDAPAAQEDAEWAEVAAWNRVVLYARKFSAEQLEKNALRNLKFADLFEDVRRDYKLDLVRFEGRLIRVTEGKPTRRMREAGVEHYYEGWLVPTDEPRGNPICLVMTELPEGIKPADQLSHAVSFAGYSFKLLRYKSAERDKAERNVVKRAPLLIGRSVTPLADPAPYAGGTWGTFFVPAAVGGLGMIALSGFGLNWWFRRGDIRVKQAIEAKRVNPFGN